MKKYLDDLRIFKKTMETRSYTRVAESERVSKSHISKVISRLEEQLGIPLFDRNSRKVVPSPQAEALYQNIAKNIQNISDYIEEIKHSSKVPKGLLRITTAGEYGEKFIAPKALEFMKAHPQVQVEMLFSNEVLDLADNQIDLAIRTGSLPDSDLIARPISSRRLTTVYSPRYLSENSEPKTPDDLKHHACLVGTSNQWSFKHESESRYVKVQGPWKSNNGRALVQAAISGLGIVQLPETYTLHHLEQGTLVECLEKYQSPSEPVWAVYRKQGSTSTTVQAFIELLIGKG